MQELMELLEKTNDKMKILTDREIIAKHKLKVGELCELIKKFLNDEEKLNLFNYPLYKNMNENIKGHIIQTIVDENTIIKILKNEEIMNGFYKYDIKEIILKISEEKRVEIIQDTNLLDKLGLKEYDIEQLTEGLSNDKDKVKIMELHDLNNLTKSEIIKSFNDKHKIEALLENSQFERYYKLEIMKTLDSNFLCEFLKEHKEYLEESSIYPYQVICKLEKDKQVKVFNELENMDFSINEQKEILALLNEDVKKEIDITGLSEELKMALNMRKNEYSEWVDLDLNKNAEEYLGLDRVISVSPQKFDNEQKEKLMKICEVCPEMNVDYYFDKYVSFSSNGREYKEAEEWIESIIDQIDPQYSDAQKIAVIDNLIGKKISYSPDFDTEVFNNNDCRAIWRIISTGYGVCNGIAETEQYILNKMGIECETVAGEHHVFLKINDIEVPLANGEKIKGNTILDPTWNLTAHRYGARPGNFFINYEEARRNDIDLNGKDYKAHENDEMLKDATLMLDDQSLRQLFKSVKLADKDGQFPIKELMEKSNKIDMIYSDNVDENINKQFQLLREECPEFATCQESTMVIISDILLCNENMNFEKCVVNRVYKKSDEDKRPIMYVYVNIDENNNKFYYADKNEGKFIELPMQDFIKEFECYDNDLEKSNGVRPWENDLKERIDKDLTKSSGKIVAEKGEGR